MVNDFQLMLCFDLPRILTLFYSLGNESPFDETAIPLFPLRIYATKDGSVESVLMETADPKSPKTINL